MLRTVLLPVLLIMTVAANSQTLNRNARDFFYTGTGKIGNKNYEAAIEDLNRAITLDPAFKQAYENRGVAKFYLNDFQGAVDDYSKALEIDPTDFSTHGRRGWARFYLHDYRGAIEDLDIAVSGSQDKFRYYNFRGEAKFRLQDTNGAVADFSKVISSSEAPGEQKGKAFFWRGLIMISLGEQENGCNDLARSLKLHYPMAEKAFKDNCGK